MMTRDPSQKVANDDQQNIPRQAANTIKLKVRLSQRIGVSFEQPPKCLMINLTIGPVDSRSLTIWGIEGINVPATSTKD